IRQNCNRGIIENIIEKLLIFPLQRTMNHQRRKYGYSYDNQHRLTAAYYQVPGTVAPRSDSYSTSYSYDENGNILNLKRNVTQDWHLAVIPIDDIGFLSYGYYSKGYDSWKFYI